MIKRLAAQGVSMKVLLLAISLWIATGQEGCGGKVPANNPAPSTTPTTSASPATAPLQISGISSNPSSTTALITWVTDQVADGQVEYGPTTSYGQATALDRTLTTSHTATLVGLLPATTYHYRIHDHDTTANAVVSSDFTLITSSVAAVAGGGWKPLANTVMTSVCPADDPNGQWADVGMTGTTAYPFGSQCRYVVDAWGGAAVDDVNQRLIVWGGGHADYAGNEVFVLNLGGSAAVWQRFLDPTKPVPYLGDGVAWEGLVPYFATLGDGGTYKSGATPASRHTYNGLQFVPYQNKLYSFGGSVANKGWFSKEVWALDMGTKQWILTAPYGQSPSNPVTAYNPSNGHVLVHDLNWTLSDYDPRTNSWKALNSNVNIPAGSSGVVDPVNNWLVFVQGDGQYPNASTTFKVRAFDLSGGDGYALHTWDDPSCRLVSSYGGLAWDSVLRLMVGYPGGGNQLYLLNSGPTDVVTPYGTVPTHKCLNVTMGTTKGVDYPTDPAGVAGAGSYTNGVFGRFAYFPSLDLFVLVNDATQNAWTLKLSR